jgi:hypothetical protein
MGYSLIENSLLPGLRKPHALGLTSIGNVTIKMGKEILTFGVLNEIN